MTNPVIKTIEKVVPGTSKAEHEYRWSQLQDIERRRRAILQFVEEPFWKVILHYNGTVWPHIMSDALFWITMAIYAVIRVRARFDLPDYLADLVSNELALLGGFLTFFLVFYVNQSHKRYFWLYDRSMGCKGRIFDAATLAYAHLPKERAARLVRYMNVAHAVGYVGLSKTYPANVFFARVNAECGLLTDSELQRMQDIDLDKGGSCNREAIAWAMRDVQEAYKAGLLDRELANMLRDQVLQLRAQIGELYNAADLPIPFFYVHFIALLTAIYLPLFAISSGFNAGTGTDLHWTSDVVSGLILFLQSIFVIGLRVLGQKLSDPYGDDLIDLSVMYYVDFVWLHSNRVLNAYTPPPPNLNEEESLQKKRKTIGAAWEHGGSDEESS